MLEFTALALVSGLFAAGWSKIGNGYGGFMALASGLGSLVCLVAAFVTAPW